MLRKSDSSKNKSRKGVDRALEHLNRLDREGLQGLAEKLCAERQTLERILQSLHEAVIVVDRWGMIELINGPAERMLGLPHVEAGFPSPSLWKAVPELAMALKVAGDGALYLAGSLSQELEIRYPAPRQVRLFATPMDDEERLLIVLSDVTTDREGTGRQMEEARLGAVTQLAAGVAHELGNPLNVLQIHLQLLERALKVEKLSSKGQRSIPSSLQVAQNEIKRLDQIIRNFLQAIRPSPPNLHPTDLLAVLEEVLGVLHAELEGAQVKVGVELPGPVPAVLADPEQIKQVFFNLIKNSREAMESGGLLKIRANQDDEWLHLHFTDSGSGIKKESLTHLFEPYYTTKPGGSGLGMMIAQKIMRVHRGRIGVESKEGSGTTVSLAFPLQYKKFKTLEGREGMKRLE